jgi:all-trans-retinol 13,14-reductase
MKYDVIIIGGGLSGLMAAAGLAKKKKKVIVLEQHLTVGGLAAGFTRKGYYFDSGMSRISRSSLMNPFKGLDIIKDTDLKPQTSAWNIKGRCFDYRSLNMFFKELADIFPEDKSGLMSLYEEQIKKREALFKRIMPENPVASSGSEKIAGILGILKYIPLLVKETSSKITANDVLKRYLDENGEAYSFLAVKEDELNYRGQMNIFMFVGKWYTQLYNVCPVNGFQGIVDKMAGYVKGLGGDISTSSQVKRILVENGKCTGVEAVIGGKTEILSAANVISAIDLRKAYYNLIGEEHMDNALKDRLRGSRLTPAIPILYLGLNVPREKIREYFHGNEELFYVPVMEKTGSDTRCENYYRYSWMVMHSSCLFNPDHAPENKCNIQIYLQCPPKGWMDNWGIVDGKRTDEYKRIKKMVTCQLLESLENVIPDIKDRSLVEVCELGTPYTIERYTGNTDGSGCGFTMDGDLLNSKKRGKYSDQYDAIKNLYFVGHQTGYRGTAGTALMSGKHIAEIIQ